jgi:hypothetical protein
LISRQKVVGWVLIVVSALFIAYFLKVRLLSSGPALERADWVRFIGAIATLMIGTINVRMAAMRGRKSGGLR